MGARAITPLIGATILAGCLAASAATHEPMDRAALRPVLLGFGDRVTPDSDHNPIDPPERFSGYHVGADFEVTDSELTRDIPIFAICEGPVAFAGFVKGYGGLLTQACVLRDEEVTVLYGHLSIDSLQSAGTELEPGSRIGILADANSHDSGETRKHLHLGIRRGTDGVEGYVQEQGSLDQFIDPLSVLSLRPAGRNGILTPYWKR